MDSSSNRNRRASVLIICLAFMMVLAVMGVSLTRITAIDRGATHNYVEGSAAQLMARAGIDYAIVMLHQRYAGVECIDMVDSTVNPTTAVPNYVDTNTGLNDRSWFFWYDEPSISPYTTARPSPGGTPHDDVGDGVQLEDLADTTTYFPRGKIHPSFYRHDGTDPEGINCVRPSAMIGNRKVTFLAEDTHYTGENRPYYDGLRQSAFTLKIFDTTAQINLNMQMDPAILPFPTGPIPSAYQYPPGTDPTDGSATNDPRLVAILDNLSTAIAELPWYQVKYPPDTDPLEIRDTNGPFQGLGKNIVTQRIRLGGFRSKWDLAGITDGTYTITTQDVLDAWDYIAVHPGVDEYKVFQYATNVNAYNTDPLNTPHYNLNPYRRMRPKSSGDSGNSEYRADYRSPVNVNTASWPVLVALFQGLEGDVDGSGSADATTETIDEANAQDLADAIIAYRRYDNLDSNHDDDGPFGSWKEWATFVDGQAGGTITAAEAQIIKSMSGSTPTLDRTNPDRPLSFDIDKTELVFYTTEVCFCPYGLFEITSLGEILDNENTTLATAKAYAVVNVYDMVRLCTQEHFDLTQSQSQSFTEQQENNAFALGNNIQGTDPPTIQSQFFGYVQPMVAYDDGYTFDDSDDKIARLAHLSGADNLIHHTTYRLRTRVDFNNYATGSGDLTPLEEAYDGSAIAAPPPPPPPVPTPKNAGTAGILPNDNTAPGELASDGVVFALNDTTLCYQPPNVDGANNSIQHGSMSFWFKLREYPPPPNPPNPPTWTPIFFMTQPACDSSGNVVDPDTYLASLGYEIDDGGPDDGEQLSDWLDERGITPPSLWVQTYIAMRYENTPTPPTLFLEAGRKYVLHPMPPLDDLDPGVAPGEITTRGLFYISEALETEAAISSLRSWATLELTDEAAEKSGEVRTKEWYHVLLRWNQTVRIDDEGIGSVGPASNGLIASGNFYDDTTGKVQNSGPVIYPPAYDDGVEAFDAGLSLSQPTTMMASLTAWYSQELSSLPANGRMYFGNMPESFTVNGNTMTGNIVGTIDDIRFANTQNFNATTQFEPSRYLPVADPTTDWVGDFAGQVPAAAGSTPGAFFVDVWEWDTEFDAASAGGPITVPPPSLVSGTYHIRFKAPAVGLDPMFQAPAVVEMLVSYHRRHPEMLGFQWISE